MVKHLFALGLILLSCLPLRAETLLLATLEFPPYAFASGDKAEGLAPDLVREAFRRLNRPVSIKVLPWSRGLEYLKAGEIDGMFPLFKTAERQHFADFCTVELIFETVSLFVSPDSAITFDGDLTRLGAYAFGVRQDFNYGHRFSAALRDGVIPRIATETEPEFLFLKLLNGRIDILIGDRLSIPFTFRAVKEGQRNRQFARYPALKKLNPDVETTPSYMTFSKKRDHADVRDRLDRILREMYADGTVDTLTRRWSVTAAPAGEHHHVKP